MDNADERDCTSCAQSPILLEIPGQFRDFDADRELHGTCGIPLCSRCLGTGWCVGTAEFIELGKEVSKLRSNNLAIQIKASENERWRIQVEANNERLIEIARRALELVGEPAKNCLAIKLINGEW